jgi:CheY-like chemotaxis protein
VAEDDPVSCHLISSRLAKCGYVGVIASDGAEAMAILGGRATRYSGDPIGRCRTWKIEICRRLRERQKMIYIILLTANGTKKDIAEGLPSSL